MAERYIDLRGGDRLELDEVAREVLGEVIRPRVKEAVETVVEVLKEEGRATAKVQKEIHGVIADLADPCLPVAELMNELGRRGWEFLPPATVRKVREELEIARAFRQSRLSKVLAGGKMHRAPRMKKPRR